MNNKTHLKHKRRNKKLLLLFLVFGITTLAFIGITYAWFVGMGEVKVNSFTVNLKTDNALEISLDGYTWDEEISVDETKIKAHSEDGLAYENNKNSWVGENGLIPVSSSGDNSNGRLSIYSKTSLTTSEGGYRLVAGSVDNSTNEKNYYVAFDIFVKNKTGDVYNTTYNLLDDENIYLTSDSTITGTASGDTSYGVQNTARVAFVQIGRISLDDLEDGVTPVIKCQTPATGETYTPLCNEESNHYRTMIWEPNDLAHDSKLVNYYNYVCKKRSLDGTYTDQACTDITSGYVPTYTIKKNIASSDNVDIYDGLNYYTSDISLPTETAKSLQNTKTFTDTMKATGGQYTLMKLHPHSVTKIRVYVYLEGQDVDNYDLITNDVDIVVNFGFTKERNYTGTIVEDSYFSKTSSAIPTSHVFSGPVYINSQAAFVNAFANNGVNINNKEVILSADIDLTGVEFTAAENVSFKFDGNGHVIRNLHNVTNSNAGGLVNSVGEGNEIIIKNLSLTNATVESTSTSPVSVGGIIGDARSVYGVSLENVAIYNTTVTNSSGGPTGGYIGYTSGHSSLDSSSVVLKNNTCAGAIINGLGSSSLYVGYSSDAANTTTYIENCSANGGNINGNNNSTGTYVGTASKGTTKLMNNFYSSILINNVSSNKLYGNIVPESTGVLMIDNVRIN